MIRLLSNFNSQVAIFEVSDCADFSSYQLVASVDNGYEPIAMVYVRDIYGRIHSEQPLSSSKMQIGVATLEKGYY